MKKKEIIEKIIRKAVDNGYRGLYYNWIDAGIPFGSVINDINKIIFLHDFAKALWGEDVIEGSKYYISIDYKYVEELGIMPIWQYHLRQMVLFEDPVEYFKDFI